MFRHKIISIATPANIYIININDIQFEDELKVDYRYNQTYKFIEKVNNTWNIVQCTFKKAKKSKKDLKFIYALIKDYPPINLDRYLEDILKYEPYALDNKVIYFDVYRSIEDGFSNSKPFKTFVYQPELKNNDIVLRTKYTMINGLSLSFVDELNDKLYSDVQRMIINKFFIKSDINVIETIPVKLCNAKLSFNQYINIGENHDYINNTYYLKMHQESCIMYNRHYLSSEISTINDANITLTEYIDFITNIRPKLYLP